ncbi:indole-3-glycerol phosphate synthase TrpC [Thermoleophilum album]|uniref:Indole-3-glycerol phosphate synthase n=1 Tax=Thermoleophilum album TaxID=29539 RepID=A0A1H6FV18_THEAL|nr:indole-3-glycerol phosphate synthase TrpC [Thermoleophilum album]SEH13998.1 indole-3-glycerol phosphate synthase [Thermoleophilum album]
MRLEALIAATREAVARRRAELPLRELERLVELDRAGRPFAEALARPGTSVIAEYKRRSPSAGAIREDLECADVVRAYERGGAAAVSVLTEERHFGGSLADLRAARSATSLPILRKDFTIDPYQVYEAKISGADAVLLVVAALKPQQLQELYALAGELDLDALVEVANEEDLERALEIDADVIGINNRDLSDFTVDVRRTFDLLPSIPAGKTVVSESGISTRSQIEELEQVGVDAVLVGEALMRALDPEQAVRELVRSGATSDA